MRIGRNPCIICCWRAGPERLKKRECEQRGESSDLTTAIETMSDVRRFIDERREPRFMLPARFRDVSFESFEVAADHPEHGRLRDRVRDFIDGAKQRDGRFWQRALSNPTGAGLFLVGPPGVGKTHLLASGYRAAEAPKLFVTFDELVATAGPLGMQRLTNLVSAPRLVCIDEIVLEDPGNIMMLVTLLSHMTESGTFVLATANMPPGEAGSHDGWMRTFDRELGQIAALFDVEHIEGRDRRVEGRSGPNPTEPRCGSVLRAAWPEIEQYLFECHPMYDAGWLEHVRCIEVQDEIQPPGDRDRALRFVRFIDRVYDRDVRLTADGAGASVDELVAPLEGDRRFVWHVARGRSRLTALLNGQSD